MAFLSTASASLTLTVYKGVGPGVAIPVSIEAESNDSIPDSLYMKLDVQSSESFAYESRYCPPFVKCFKFSDLTKTNTALFSNDPDRIYLGSYRLVPSGYTGSLIETGGVLGIGPRSVLARSFSIQFQSESCSRIQIVPHVDHPANCTTSCVSIPLDASAEGYQAIEGSYIKFSLLGMPFLTPPNIPIIFDPTIEYSVFPESFLDDLMESIGPSTTDLRIGHLKTNQLLFPSRFVPGFSLVLPDNTSIPLTDGIAERIEGGGLRYRSGIITDYIFSPDALSIIIGKSILKQTFFKSILLDGRSSRAVLEIGPSTTDRRIGHLQTNIHPDEPRRFSEMYPASAGISFRLSESSRPVVFARPYIGSEFLAQNKYFLHTFAPVEMIYKETDAIGYILECVDFVQPNFQGPQIARIPFSVYIDPNSDGGIVSVDLEHQIIAFPLIAASDENDQQKYTIETVKTENRLLIVLIPDP